MQIWSMQSPLFFLLAVESELMACSAVIKRRWRYRPASQRLPVLAGVTRLTPSLTILHKAAKHPEFYIETCSPSVSLWRNAEYEFQDSIIYFVASQQCSFPYCMLHLIWNFIILNHFSLKPVWGLWDYFERGDLIVNGGCDTGIKCWGSKETWGPLFSGDTLTG